MWEEEEEAVITEYWLKNGWMYWPTGINVMRAAYKKQPIDDSWVKYEIVKIKLLQVTAGNVAKYYFYKSIVFF